MTLIPLPENHPRVVNVYSGQHYDVFVGRGLPPGRIATSQLRKLAERAIQSHSWGNPFIIGKAGRTRASAVAAHRVHVLERPWLVDKIRAELRKKVLGCFCFPQLCHASTLAWIADTVRERPRSVC